MKYTTKKTECGQRRRYGDSYYTYIIEFENESEANVENAFDIGQTLYPCTLSASQHKEEDNSAANHFRDSYSIRKVNKKTYQYQVIYQSTH